MPFKSIPYSHVYESKLSDDLCQGDLIKLDSDLKSEFDKHYKIDYGLEYVMVISQTCDLVKTRKKINHINTCIVRPFKNFIRREVEKLKSKQVSDFFLVKSQEYQELTNVVYSLINDSNAKSHLYLAKKYPFNEDMIVVFNVNYPFRWEHYELILKNRVLSLRNDYKAKVGHIISTLYHRVIVSEVIQQKTGIGRNY